MLLDVQGLRVSYGRLEALRGVSLRVDDGEIVALVGSNGAGKTTLLRTISGLCAPRSGSVTFCGQDLLSLPTDRRVGLGLVHVPEGRRLFPGLSVRQNLELGAHQARDRAGMDERLDLVADRDNLVGVDVVADRQLPRGDHALGLEADVEEDLVLVDLHDGAADEVAVVELDDRAGDGVVEGEGTEVVLDHLPRDVVALRVEAAEGLLRAGGDGGGGRAGALVLVRGGRGGIGHGYGSPSR